MSKRKQRKPQHRKTIETLEAQGEDVGCDMLTCGDCQLVYSLGDIQKFIRHKVTRCGKENVKPNDCNGNSSEDEGEDDDKTKEPMAVPVALARAVKISQCSISAPIAARRSTPELHGTAIPSPCTNNSGPALPIRCSYVDDTDTTILNDKPKPKTVLGRTREQQSSPINAEPKQFQCISCCDVFKTAWSLLQHVQTQHHIKIYLEYSAIQGVANVNNSQKITISAQKSEAAKDDECSNGDYDEAIEEEETKDDDKKTSSPLAQSESPANTSKNSSQNATSPVNPFLSSFRLPLTDRAYSQNSSNQFPRPDQLNRFDLLEPYHRMPGVGFGFPPPSTGSQLLQSIDNSTHPAFPLFDARRPPFFASMADFDLYSKRLQKLARYQAPYGHGKTSPSAFSPSQPSPSDSGQKTPSSAAGAPVSPGTPSSLPPKFRACEFCGKTFRFQSNLIVHRRSHTGEKPFRCPLCPHACTQASKLKRHMKTHQTKPFGNWSSTASNDSSSHPSESSSPDAEQAAIIAQRLKELEGENDDELESEMDEDDEYEYEGIVEGVAGNKTNHKTGENNKNGMQNEGIDANTSDTKTKQGCDINTDSNVASISKDTRMDEVVGNSELLKLQQYKDALREALAEKCNQPSPLKIALEENDDDNGESASSNDKASDDKKPQVDCKDIKSTLQSNDAEMPLRPPPELLDYGKSKRIKLENPDISTAQQHSIEPQHHYYPNFPWFPPYNVSAAAHRDMLSSAVPFRTRDIQTNGYPGIGEPLYGNFNNRSIQSGTINATSPALVSPALMNSVPRNRSDRRNDTCEFCGKVFKNCSNLTVHRRSHTGEKPYKCTLCSYACAQSSKLTRHMRTHGRVGKDSYYCKFCNTPFSVPSTLEKHMRKCVESQNRSLHQHPAMTNVSSHHMNDMSRISQSASSLTPVTLHASTQNCV